MKRYILSALLCLLTFAAWADGETRVKEYYVNVVVHEDYSYDITEWVTVNFPEPMHGFYRYVPYAYSIDDKSYTCDIENISIEGDEYAIYDENDNYIFKIGNEDRTVKGDKDYTIGYTIRNRDDRNPDTDLFYHSILGRDFQLPIEYLGFSVVFEKGLPKDAEKKLKVMSGKQWEETNTLNADVWIEGDTIFGEVYDIQPENSVTLRLPLPEGYYQGYEKWNPTLMYLFFGITVALIVVLLFFELTRKHPSITKTIEFYPPKGMSSAEVGTIIDNSVDAVDLASLIPTFASKGFVTLKEVEEKNFLGIKKTDLEMKKNKPLASGTPYYQQRFYSLLFEGTDGTVKLQNLPKKESEVTAIKKLLKDEFQGDKKLTTWHWSVWLIIPIILSSSLMFISSLPCRFFENTDWEVFIIWSLYLGGSAYLLYKLSNKSSFTKKSEKVIFLILRMLAFIVMCGITLLTTYLFNCNIDMIAAVAVAVACFIVIELLPRLNISSRYRADMIGKLLGLKEFIETAEKPRLEELQKEDPEYFFKILPYAMVFQISTKWAERFKNINLDNPSWYSGTNAGRYCAASSLVSCLSNSCNSAISTMSPSSSNGVGAGGGTGGGGGGAW